MTRDSVNTSIALHGAIEGIDLQFSHVKVKRLGFMINASAQNRNLQGGDYRNHIFAEAGAGKIWLPKKNINLGLWGGYGFGHASARDNYYFIGQGSSSASGDYHRIFTQGSAGILGTHGGGALALRMSYLSFANYSASSADHSHPYIDALVIEPAAQFNIVFGRLSWESQAGLSIPVGDTYRMTFDHRYLMLSTGLRFKISRDCPYGFIEYLNPM